MKQLIIAMVVVTTIIVLSYSSVSAKEITTGVKAGINITNLYGDDVSDIDFKTGLCGGGFLTYNISDTFALQPELLFSMKGAKGKDIDYTLKLNYIEIPILAKLLFSTIGDIKPSLFFGPSISILMSAKVEFDGGEVNIKDDTKSTDFGLVFGGSLASPLDYPGITGDISLDVRYSLGLSSTDDSDDAGEVKNQVISIMVGYAF